MSYLLSLQNTWKPTHYDLDLVIDHKRANFTGVVIIDLQRSNVASHEFEFTLNSAELVILNAVFETSSGEQLKATVSYEKAAETVKLNVGDVDVNILDSIAKIQIKYIGKVNTIKTFQDFTRGIFKTNYLDNVKGTAENFIIATHSQASFARYIFPSVDEPSCKTTFKLRLTTDSRFKVLSNTSVELISAVDENTKKTTFAKTPIMNTSIFAFVVGDLDFIESTIKLQNTETKVRFYTPIGESAKVAYPLDIAVKALPFIESQFQYPYPLDKLDFVALPFLTDGAMENFGLITIQSSHVLLGNLADQRVTQSVRQLIVHEIIHHWIGDNVSFDEWDHIWLNESFATWFAYLILYKLELEKVDSEIWIQQADQELETLFESDSLENAKPIVSKAKGSVKATQDAFEAHSYQKGIHFLRMLANVFENDKFDDNFPSFISALAKFIKKNEFKSIKPTDLWVSLNEDSDLDLLAFTHSWLRVAGYPIVKVSIDESGSILLEQHRYLSGGVSIEALNLEDIPYHIPLAIRLKDGTVVNKIMNDRKLILNDIKPQDFVKLNANRIGFYRVHYRDVEFYQNFCNNLDQLSTLDILGFIHDWSDAINKGLSSTSGEVTGFLKIAKALIESKVLNFKVLPLVMSNLESLQDSYRLYSDEKSFTKLNRWLQSLCSELLEKLDWDNVDYRTLSADELETRKWLLTIGLEDPEVSKISTKIFKNLLHGPRGSVPVQLLDPVLSATALYSNQSTWKKILELVKKPGATTANVSATFNETQEIQNAAVKSIGYTKDPALVKRVLNFVANNIDSTMVELALVGLQYNREQNKQILWDWYKLNYDLWVSKSSRAGSQYSANLAKTVKSITIIVLSGMTSEEDHQIVKSFVESKSKKFPEHGLQNQAELIKSSQLEKYEIAKKIESALQKLEL